MKIDSLTIYLWQLADSLRSTFQGFTSAAAIPAVILFVASLMGYDLIEKDFLSSMRKWGRRLIIISAALGILQAMIPSSNTIAMMVVIPKIAESKVIQQDLPEMYDIAIKALKEQISPKK